jgi:hypothetical protein
MTASRPSFQSTMYLYLAWPLPWGRLHESNVLGVFVLYPTSSILNSTPSQILHDLLTSVFLYSQVPHINACHMGV